MGGRSVEMVFSDDNQDGNGKKNSKRDRAGKPNDFRNTLQKVEVTETVGLPFETRRDNVIKKELSPEFARLVKHRKTTSKKSCRNHKQAEGEIAVKNDLPGAGVFSARRWAATRLIATANPLYFVAVAMPAKKPAAP